MEEFVESPYGKAIRRTERKKFDKEVDSEVAPQSYKNRAAQSVQAPQAGGTPMQTGSNMLMASGDPMAMAAGAGLSVVGQIDAAKKAKAQQEYNARVSKLNREQSAYSNLAQIASSLKSL